MSIPQIVASMRRQRMMPLLIIVQIAITCAILGNTLFLLGQRLAPMLVPDGIPRGELLLIDQLVSAQGAWKGPEIQAGTRALAAIPGVRAVSPAMGVPMRQSMTFTLDLKGSAGVMVTASGFAGEGMLEALGLELERGRDFTPGDYADIFGGDGDRVMPLILTASLARTLFPDGDALGGTLHDAEGKRRYLVVGIVRHLLRYQIGELDDGKAEYSVLVPSRPTSTPILTYVVRTDPARRAEVQAAIPAVLKREFGAMQMRGIEPVVDDYESLRSAAFKPRRASVWLLTVVNLVVAAITGIGIASLTGYWIAQRTRQIGIRRALGATRGQILRYFQLENSLLVGAGLVLGMLLAYAINQMLMQRYSLPRLPVHYLPIGAAALWALGQLAVLGPALKAASVPPAIATRSA